MGLTNSQYDALMRDYNRRQRKARESLKKRREEVYEAIPEMEDLEREITSLSAARVRAALLKEPGAEPGQDGGTLEEERKALEGLREKRERLLKEAGYPKDYMELHYTCPDCRDTGYIGSEKCHCFKQAALDLLYAQSNIREALKEENFGCFSMEYYDDTRKNQDFGVTSYENMEDVVRQCKDMIARFASEHGSLLLMGDVGIGKTFLARCIAKELLEQYYSVVYLSANELFELLSRFRCENEEEEEEKSRYILDSDLLIIDDLGTELSNSLTTSKLFYCINERLLRRKGTIITTNLSLEKIRDIYSERISSRLLDSYRLCYLFGDDVRMKKKRLGIKP